MEFAISPAHCAQGPTDAFLNEITFILCGFFDHGKTFEETRIAGILFVQGETSEQRESSPPDEFFATSGPLLDLIEGVRRTIEKKKAHCIADAPIIEILAPAIHLRGRDALRFINKRRQHARFIPAGLP